MCPALAATSLGEAPAAIHSATAVWRLFVLDGGLYGKLAPPSQEAQGAAA
ncbi:MAG TPA: hypothetical protein VG276_00385 [Actinomycetes bacterium]|nr:hypothetical protein [Actinomycetes bacterium]